MRTSIRTAAAGIALSLALTASPSLAQGDLVPGDITFSGYVQGVTDYRFRGLSASGGDPAVQGTINANHSSGFYVGAWASSIDDGGTDVLGELELDLYAGWTGEVSPGFTLDVGMLRYVYPTNSFGPVDYWEPYASIATTYGPVSAKLGVAYAWEQRALDTDLDGDKDDNLYVYTDLSAGVPTTPITLNAHLGWADGAQSPDFLTGKSARQNSGFDYSVGATYNFTDTFSVGASYVGVDGNSIDGFSDDTVVATVRLAL